MPVQYHFVMNEMTPSQWISKCAERLHDRWQTVEHAQLEEVAVGIWQEERLRILPPAEAAALWLTPIASE
jgi:hypothetical protein